MKVQEVICFWCWSNIDVPWQMKVQEVICLIKYWCSLADEGSGGYLLLVSGGCWSNIDVPWQMKVQEVICLIKYWCSLADEGSGGYLLLVWCWSNIDVPWQMKVQEVICFWFRELRCCGWRKTFFVRPPLCIHRTAKYRVSKVFIQQDTGSVTCSYSKIQGQ